MLTPQHSFGSISQRNRCVLPGNARGANHNLRRRCADAICKTSRAAFAHLDRGADPALRAFKADPALRAFKNGSRHDVADRIFAPSKPQLFALRLEAEQQCAARCMLACGAGLFVRSVGKFQTAEQIACCGAERAFSKPQRFEAGDSQCSVLDRSSPVPPGSIASNRSTFGGGEGWIKRSQDSAISSQVRFSDLLRVKCAIRSHSAAFARYSSFLFMGVFANGRLSSIAKRAGRSNYRDISDIEASGARNWKKPACGGWPRSGTTSAATSLSDFSCDRGPTAAVGSAARREASPA